MLEVLINFICAFILSLVGFYSINKILNMKEKLTIKNTLILIINSILIVIIHYQNYNAIAALLNYIINVITYKIIFKIRIEQSIIINGIIILIILVADVIDVFIQIIFIPKNLLTNNIYIYLLGNIIVAIISILFISNKRLTNKLNKYYVTLSTKNLKLNIVFIILIMIAISGVTYNVIINYKFNIKFFSNILIIGSLLIISIIFVANRDSYNKLSNEYDILLSNIKNFEDWIEKEQFSRHEYKNQLAIIYALSTERKVKDKIQAIINQNLDITNETIYELRNIPKSELKGLLYYKTLVAQDNKINLTLNVSVKSKGILNKLKKEEINSLAKIIGIYYDNAIEAAKESRKKNIFLEIYELKDKVNIVISNTFKKTSIISNNTYKGISSKGKGRGNGLYFAQRILTQNKWLKEKQEIIDKYYVETITIEKNTSKK